MHYLEKELTDKRIKVTRKKQRFIAAEIYKGLPYLHTQRVVHGDIKPANI